MARAGAPVTQLVSPGRRAGRLLAGLMLLAVTACSTGFIYNRVGWAVSWYVGGFVSLDESQERQLQDAVRRTLVWHRATQLERYVGVLEGLAAAAAGPLTVDTLQGQYQEAEQLLSDLLGQIAPDAARLLGSLDAGQRAELARNLEESNAELREDRAGQDPQARQQRRSKVAVRVIQRFTGRLTPAQRQLVGERLATMQDLDDAWLQRRQAWQQQLLGLLETSDRGPAFEQAVRDLLLDSARAGGEDYRRGAEANRRVVLAMLAALSETLDPGQRERLQRKLRGYAQDLRRLAEAG
ncbi:hypothetical protein GPROT2_01478 [Gammaproteobacteria bacterium]|nr:hypothetical protein GPROT2_01478 [Gammaproteobacteria bacterium]